MKNIILLPLFTSCVYRDRTLITAQILVQNERETGGK